MYNHSSIYKWMYVNLHIHTHTHKHSEKNVFISLPSETVGKRYNITQNSHEFPCCYCAACITAQRYVILPEEDWPSFPSSLTDLSLLLCVLLYNALRRLVVVRVRWTRWYFTQKIEWNISSVSSKEALTQLTYLQRKAYIFANCLTH